jgi:hypothetical protein
LIDLGHRTPEIRIAPVVGLDSLAATELSSRLRGLSGISISSTLVFEQPTPRAIVTHLLEQLGGPKKGTLPTVMIERGTSRALALAQPIGRWPGGCSTAAQCWQMQHACGDAVGQVRGLVTQPRALLITTESAPH